MAELIRVGTLTSPPVEAPPPSFHLSWNRLVYSTRVGLFSGKVEKILDGVTGRAPAGTLTAVLGPSGSGKTTLLDLLSGLSRGKYEGSILVNDRRIPKEFYRRECCYVPQDVFLFPNLSVGQTLMVAANLKLRTSVTKEKKEKKVKDILQTLNLLQCEHTKTNKLSGGEKRRVSIAQELVSNPSVMILDEPTSGLDSTLAYQCVDLLLKLANEGRTVVCSIHQPSSSVYDLFHNLHILSKGKCIYSGLNKDFTSYLSSCGLECPQYHNPADYILDIANDVLPGRNLLLAKRNDRRNREFHKLDYEKISSLSWQHSAYPTSFYNQFLVLLKRLFISTCNPITLLLYLISEILLASLIGMIYRGSGGSSDKAPANLGFLALTILILTFAAILPTLLNFPAEKIGVLREYHNGWYSVTPYFLAKSIAELPINFIFPSIFVSFVYWLTGQSLEAWRFVYFVAISVCLTLNVQSLPIIFGSVFSDRVTVFVVPVLCLPLLLFCNFFAINNALPSYLEWITKVSPFALCYQGETRQPIPRLTINAEVGFLDYGVKYSDDIDII